MGEVRDEKMGTMAGAMVEPGKVLAPRARARSTGPLRCHHDRCDVFALLAASNSKAGGISKLANNRAIHNEMLRRRPNLLELLFPPFWRRRPEDIEALQVCRFVALPGFGPQDGKLTRQYSRTFLDQAQEDAGITRLSAAQDKALDLLAEIADANCLHAGFARGDIQLLDNHVICHRRTAYENDASTGQARVLLRPWLVIPNSRSPPSGFAVYWSGTAPGAGRAVLCRRMDAGPMPHLPRRKVCPFWSD